MRTTQECKKNLLGDLCSCSAKGPNASHLSPSHGNLQLVHGLVSGVIPLLTLSLEQGSFIHRELCSLLRPDLQKGPKSGVWLQGCSMLHVALILHTQTDTRPLLLAALFLFHLGAALPSLQARHCRLQCLREKKKQPQGDGAVTSPGTFLPKLSSMGAKCRRGEMC